MNGGDYSAPEGDRRARVERLRKLIDLNAPRPILKAEIIHLAERECGGRWGLMQAVLERGWNEVKLDLWWWWWTKVRMKTMAEMDELIERRY